MEESTSPKPTVFSVSIKYGLILAGISIILFVLQIVLGINPLVDDWKKWIRILIAIGIIVLAHKNFKDSGDGFMTYGQGLGIGFMLVMISAIVAGIFTFIYINLIDVNLMDEVWEKALEQAQERGQSEEQAQIGIEWGKKLFWVIYLVAVGFGALIMGLIVSIFTQKKNPEPFV